MRCSKCDSDNREGRKFCAECGARLATTCAKCGAVNEPNEKFCGECGASPALSAEPVIAQTPSAAPSIRVTSKPPDAHGEDPTHFEGERKIVTALFADLKGSTELMRELDPEEARAILDPVLQLMMAAVHRYDGYVAQSTGDGIFAMFGAPVAHEDHAQRALHAALAIQDGLRHYRERTEATGRLPLEARIGINTGEVVLRLVNTGAHTEYSPVGHAANLAARLQTVAPPGGVIVSDDTRKLVEDYFELRHLVPATLKGFAEPVNVYEVMSAGSLRGHFEVAARRGLTRFVGREHELAQIRRALELAMGGHGQLVAIVAEAGAGKSRLVYEFKALLPNGFKLLEAYSVSYGKASAWLPVLELLRDYFAIETADDASTRRDKVQSALAALDPGLNDTMPYIWGLLGIQEMPDPLGQMDLHIRRRRTLEAIKRIVLRESLNQPTVVIFEDLHWVDSATQALLDRLTDSIAGVRLLLLVNYRPEYRHEWSSRAHYLQLRLDQLGGENAASMLDDLLGNGADLLPLKRQIIDRTGGNPFFIEEMVQALFEQGILAQNGAVKLARPLAQAHLPVTVQGVLAARIDRLQPSDRDLLHTLAVLGREFPLGLVQHVAAGPTDELERGLLRLQAGEFIHEQPVSGDVEFVFKHALTQEVAYNSILVERRKILHERIAHAIESLFPHRLDDHLSELARHYSQSGDASKAAHFLSLAGELAARRSIHEDAIGFFKAALAMVGRLPDNQERLRTRLELNFALLGSLTTSGGYATPEVAETASITLELGRRLKDPQLEFSASMFQWAYHANRRDLATAGQISKRLLQLADEVGDPFMIVHANQASGTVSLYRGEIGAAVDKFENVLRTYKQGRCAKRRKTQGFCRLDIWRWPSGFQAIWTERCR
jgi:class 3 adenylate cyclase